MISYNGLAQLVVGFGIGEMMWQMGFTITTWQHWIMLVLVFTYGQLTKHDKG